MKTFIAVVLALMFPVLAHSQYIPNSAQNFHFASLYNPAFTGMENYLDLKVGYRYQWTGFKENAPQFANIAANFRIKQPLDLRTNALRPSRTDFSRIVPRRKLTIHGLGFNAYAEKFGPLENKGGGVQYAIHMPLSEKVNISAGVGAMLQNTGLNAEDLYWGANPDPGDPVYDKVMAGGIRHTELWTRAGLLIYGERFYVGGTYYPFSRTISDSELAFSDPSYNIGVQAGFAFALNEDFDLKPTVWALVAESGELMIDYSAKFYMQDRVWFGLTYRDVSAGAISGGFNISELFSASYSYEFSLGDMRTFGGGTHELLLAFRLNNIRHVNQRIW